MKINKLLIGDKIKYVGPLKKHIYGEIIAIFNKEAIKVIGCGAVYEKTPYLYLVKTSLPVETKANGATIYMTYAYIQEEHIELSDWIDELEKEINK